LQGFTSCSHPSPAMPMTWLRRGERLGRPECEL
jgi:hypothetical protein